MTAAERPPLQAIAFDLWETLITDTAETSVIHEAARVRDLRQVLAGAGFERTDAEIRDANRQLWSDCYDHYWSQDIDIPTRRQIEYFVRSLGYGADEFSEELLRSLEDAYSRSALEVLPPLVPGAGELLRHLRGCGLRIGLVSNTGRTPGLILREVLKLHDVLGAFDAVVFSNEHGACKPQRSIFTELLRQLEVDAAATAFVGDNIYCDVYGAQSAGMRGILFEPRQKGNAVAPPFEHRLEIIPDGRVGNLEQIGELIAEWM